MGQNGKWQTGVLSVAYEVALWGIYSVHLWTEMAGPMAFQISLMKSLKIIINEKDVAYPTSFVFFWGYVCRTCNTYYSMKAFEGYYNLLY